MKSIVTRGNSSLLADLDESHRRAYGAFRPPLRTWNLMLLASVVFLLLPSSVNSFGLGIERREVPTQRGFVFNNQSGRRVDIFWINRSTDPVEYRSNSEDGKGYPYGSGTAISSYIGHEFQIREMPSKTTGECMIPGDCRTAYFQVNDQERQRITIDKEWKVKHEDDQTRASDQAENMLETCEKKIEKEWGDRLDPLELVDAITECMEVEVNRSISKQEEERAFQSRVRHQMANELAPYACGDVKFPNSWEIVNRSWTFEDDKFQLQVFHERPTSNIFRIRNFTTPEECNALKYFLTPDGTQVPFLTVNDMTKQGQLVHLLASRFYDLARVALDWPTLEFGEQYDNHRVELFDIYKDTNGVSVLPTCTEEDLQGFDATDPKPPEHCQLPGATKAKVPTKHFVVDKPNQVANVFLFCGQDANATLGGIHFPDAAVHINSEPNMLVMVVHRHLDDPVMDGFTTSYHFCPNYDILTHTFYVEEDGEEEEDGDEEEETTQSPGPAATESSEAKPPDFGKDEL